jgi:Tfp pilus assembly protein PilP
MKRTLTLCLLLGLAASLSAQSPKVVEKAVAPAKGSAAPAKTAPANVKVVAVPTASKPSAVAVKAPAPRPAVVAVQPAKVPVAHEAAAHKGTTSPKPAVAVVPAKTMQAPHVIAVRPENKASHATRVAASPRKDAFEKRATNVAKAEKARAGTPKHSKTSSVVAVKDAAPDEKKPEPKKIVASNRRDPFVSPVVRLGSAGSGCSTGKRCLAIDQVLLKGVVSSENGMIAVVVNAMNKAYFLRENDPVFNGYVTKITPDSVVFKETFHDKLGKELTRDVTKSISRPAA